MSLEEKKIRIFSGLNTLVAVIGVIRMFVFISCLLLFITSSSRAADIQDDAANRIVSGIISFTHWPGLTHPPQLCVMPTSRHLMLPAGSNDGAYRVINLASEEELLTQCCDAVYFVQQSPQQQEMWLEKISSKPVLAIAENNPECTVGAAFCLIFQHDKTLFSVNLDSLARSGVKVNPDVLLLSRKGSQ